MVWYTLMTKVAVMQPYAFPYFGYLQLMKAVDHFVFMDDVTFIKKGWMNRNKLIANGKEQIFTIPVNKISPDSSKLEFSIHTFLDIEE